MTTRLSLIVLSVLLVSSCSELKARRDIQKGDKLYNDGKYAEAIEVYQGSLNRAVLATGHHNLAMTALAAFKPGIETKANAEYAKLASEHLQEYLKFHPKNQEIIELLTTVWLDSDQTDVALQYWEAERVKNPNSIMPIRKLSSIERMAGHYSEALKWDYKRVELSTRPEDKARALVQIGQLQYKRLAKPDIVDKERIEIADIGIAALQQALTLKSDNASIHSLIATIYQFRSLAHQTGWARLTDAASQRYHHLERKRLVEEAKAKRDSVSKYSKDMGDTPKEAKE